MWKRMNMGAVFGLCVLAAVLLSFSGEEVLKSGPGMIHSIRAALKDLARDGRSYLGRLAGEQTVQSAEKVLGVVAEIVARDLNLLLQYVSQLLQDSGVKGGVPINKVTPEGVIFVAQWILPALIGSWLLSWAFQLVAPIVKRALQLFRVARTCYWVVSRVFRLVACILSWVLWLLKIVMVVVCFTFILNFGVIRKEYEVVVWV